MRHQTKKLRVVTWSSVISSDCDISGRSQTSKISHLIPAKEEAALKALSLLTSLLYFYVTHTHTLSVVIAEDIKVLLNAVLVVLPLVLPWRYRSTMQFFSVT